jgi:hypothetical protein
MNKIMVSRDKIISDSYNVKIDNNKISFLDNGIYFIEYIDINQIELIIEMWNLNDVTLYESSFLKDIVVNNRYVINNSKLRVNKFYNNDNVVEKIDIDLYSNGEIDYRFSNICRNKESYEININHNGIGTVSNVNNKSIAMDGSNLDFVINSIVKKEYEKSVLNQNTRIVTFGLCDTKISPNMFIDCDDIEARHGSVIGTFKDEMVFYLMSRGIPYNDAIKLLIKGYLFSNIDAYMELRDKIFNVIDMYWR